MIPLATSCFIYTGQWTHISFQQILSLENNAFASSLGSVLLDNPLWNLIQIFLGGFINSLNLNIDMNLFFPDASTLSFTPYAICELIGMSLFMLVWLRLQINLLSLFFRTIPHKNSIIENESIFLTTLFNGISFSISLLGAFFSTVLFNAIRNSEISWISLLFTIATTLIVFLGIKKSAASYSLFNDISIIEEILSSLIKVATLFMSMYLSYHYFYGYASSQDPKAAFLIIGWIAGMHGLNGQTIWGRLGGLSTVLFFSIIVGV